MREFIFGAMAVAAVILLVLGSRPDAQPSGPAYTGRLKIDAGTEYAALDTPSPIGGACEGWSAVEIRKPGMPGTGMTDVVCWKREGENITLSDGTGAQRKSGPASVWSD